MSRTTQLEHLSAHDSFDLAVIGGGATGLGIALNAIQRGFSVVVLESHDFASGTSSRSTKLLHGGVRYLAQGNIHLVREALRERTTIMAIAPHLAQPLSFVMPSYRYWQTPFYGLGLKLYDLLAGDKGLGRTTLLNRAETLATLPGIKANRLCGGVQYWDGQFEDARLALALVKSLVRAGGTALNYAQVDAVERIDGRSHPFSLSVTDRIENRRFKLRSKAAINATGVWVDHLRHRALSDEHSHLVSPSQGVHIVIRQDFLPSRQALLVPRTQDGRVLFAVPWLGALVLGTTDTPRQDLPREPQPFDEELAFIFTEASRVLSRPVRHSDVQSVWVGLRPLVATSERHATQSLSREHTIVHDDNGLITVTGGKWTTFRVMAEDTLNACFQHGLLPARPMQAQTEPMLVGAPNDTTAPVSLATAPGIHLYGAEKPQVLALPGADRMLGLGLTEAMVRYAVRAEWALTVEDVLARRSRALFLDADLARQMAEPVAHILAEETGRDPLLNAFLALARSYTLKNH